MNGRRCRRCIAETLDVGGKASVDAVVQAYVAGMRADDMADQAVWVAFSYRYGIQVLIFQPPRLEALEAAEARRRRNSIMKFRPYKAGVEGLQHRPPTAMILATNMHCEHFEPIIPVNSTTQRPGRFTTAGSVPEREGWCPILDMAYVSDAARQRV